MGMAEKLYYDRLYHLVKKGFSELVNERLSGNRMVACRDKDPHVNMPIRYEGNIVIKKARMPIFRGENALEKYTEFRIGEIGKLKCIEEYLSRYRYNPTRTIEENPVNPIIDWLIYDFDLGKSQFVHVRKDGSRSIMKESGLIDRVHIGFVKYRWIL
jgi:hypothetical protein